MGSQQERRSGKRVSGTALTASAWSLKVTPNGSAPHLSSVGWPTGVRLRGHDPAPQCNSLPRDPSGEKPNVAAGVSVPAPRHKRLEKSYRNSFQSGTPDLMLLSSFPGSAPSRPVSCRLPTPSAVRGLNVTPWAGRGLAASAGQPFVNSVG